MMPTTATERECGYRSEGGIYLEVDTSPYGEPLEHFIIDPPILVPDPNRAGYGAQGQTMVRDAEGVYHLVDWVGANFYENVADFVEEARYFLANGLGPPISRKSNPKMTDYALLTDRSRIYFLHTRAGLRNAKDFYGVNEPELRLMPYHDPYTHHASLLPCAWGVAEHNYKDAFGYVGQPKGQCARLHYQNLVGGVMISPPKRDTLIQLNCGAEYRGYVAPPEVEPEYCPAFFMWAPISRLAVIEAGDGSHQEALDKLKRSGTELPIIEAPF